MIILPDEETFGYLVLASAGASYLGAGFFSVYAVKNWRPNEPPEEEEETEECKKINSAAPVSYGGVSEVTKL